MVPGGGQWPGFRAQGRGRGCPSPANRPAGDVSIRSRSGGLQNLLLGIFFFFFWLGIPVLWVEENLPEIHHKQTTPGFATSQA